MSATAASGGGGKNENEVQEKKHSSVRMTAGYESDDENNSSSPRNPKRDKKAKERLQLVEPSWQIVVPAVKAGKEALSEGNDDPNLTKWSKKYLPGVLDAVVKIQDEEHIVDQFQFGGILCKIFDIIELAVQGRPCYERKKNDDFLSNFRECNELILTVLTAFASLRGGLYFDKEQIEGQYGSAPREFEGELIGINVLLLDCSPTALNDDPDEEQDAPVPASSSSWKQYMETMIQLKQSEFVKCHNELGFWSQRLKAAINYVDPANQEEQKMLQMNTAHFKSGDNNNNNKNKKHIKCSQHANPTSVEAIRQDLAVYYNDVEFSMPQSSTTVEQSQQQEQDGEESEQEGEDIHKSKFEDFFCNLRLKKRQKQQQSVTDGEFVSASHLPTRLRSAAHTVLVTGPGGCGKTVALKHICIQQSVQDSVIVFVPLKELRGLTRRIDSIEELFNNCSAFAALSEEQIQAIVEKRIPVIFAFDGFDEVHNAQEEDKHIANFLNDMIDPVKRQFSLKHNNLTKLVRDCDRVIISSREERIASKYCKLDSVEARPLVDELALQLWTNSEVERFCLRFFSNAFKKQHQEQQNQKGENEQEQLAKAVRTATNDVISSLASPLMDSWRGLPLAVTLLSQLRSDSASQNNKVLNNMSPAHAYSLVLEMHWRRNKLRVEDRLLRCRNQYIQDCMNDHKINLAHGVTPELFELVLNCAAEASFNQLLSTNSNVTEISFSSSNFGKLPLWAALLRETGLIRVENNGSKATFSHRSWIEFLCARHAALTGNSIEQISWNQRKFAAVWLLLADFARSQTFGKALSVQRFSFVVMNKYAEKIKETVKKRIWERFGVSSFDVDTENSEASLSLLARIASIVKPEDLFLLRVVTRTEVLDFAKKHLDQLPKLIQRSSVTCSKCKTHFSEAPADWKCNKCNVHVWNEAAKCESCSTSFGLLTWRHKLRCCGRCVCSDCVFEWKRVSSDEHYFCERCAFRAITPVTNQLSASPQNQKVNVAIEETLDENDSRFKPQLQGEQDYYSSSQKQTIAANSFILHLRWLAELCVAEGALDCFKFIEEKYPAALFGVFQEKDIEFAKSQVLSPAVARSFDNLDRPAVSACAEYIISKYNIQVPLEDAIRVNSLVGVTRAIKKMEKDHFSLHASVDADVERGNNILELFADAISNLRFDVVATMLRCHRSKKGRFSWCHEPLPLKLVQTILTWLPQHLQFRVWCEEKKDFETSTLRELAKLLQIKLSSKINSSSTFSERFEIELCDSKQLLWFQFFHLLEEVVFSSEKHSFYLKAAADSPAHLRILDLCNNENFTNDGVSTLVGRKCTKLEKIDLSELLGPHGERGRPNLNNSCLKAIAASPCTATLKVINLCHNLNFTDEGVSVLVSKCSNLSAIYLADTSISDVSLKALANSPSVTLQKPPSLVHILLSANDNVTDFGIEALKVAYGEFWNFVQVITESCKNVKKDWK